MKKVNMKKTFSLTHPKKSPANHIDSIKFEIKKYIARERRKPLPDNVDYWDFDCKIGDSDAEASVIHVSEINSKISELAKDPKESFYLEVLVKKAQRIKE